MIASWQRSYRSQISAIKQFGSPYRPTAGGRWLGGPGA